MGFSKVQNEKVSSAIECGLEGIIICMHKLFIQKQLYFEIVLVEIVSFCFALKSIFLFRKSSENDFQEKKFTPKVSPEN